jgi:hypothetical protein
MQNIRLGFAAPLAVHQSNPANTVTARARHLHLEAQHPQGT